VNWDETFRRARQYLRDKDKLCGMGYGRWGLAHAISSSDKVWAIAGILSDNMGAIMDTVFPEGG
jgi:hypothetical protein